MGKRLLVTLIALTVMVGADYFSKQWAMDNLQHYTPAQHFEGVLAGKVVYNHGMAWSLGNSGHGHWLIVLLNTLGLAIVVFWLHRALHMGQRYWLCFAVLCGGAIGNYADRLLHGAVTDFIVLHYHNTWYFPVFNLADIAITIAGAVLVYVTWKHPNTWRWTGNMAGA